MNSSQQPFFANYTLENLPASPYGISLPNEPPNFRFVNGILLPPTPFIAQPLSQTTSDEHVSAEDPVELSNAHRNCQPPSSAVKQAKGFNVDREVKRWLAEKKIKPGVNILTYEDPDGEVYKASLLPKGNVQADMDGGPVFSRVSNWMKTIRPGSQSKKANQLAFLTELKRINYNNVPFGRMLRDSDEIRVVEVNQNTNTLADGKENSPGRNGFEVNADKIEKGSLSQERVQVLKSCAQSQMQFIPLTPVTSELSLVGSSMNTSGLVVNLNKTPISQLARMKKNELPLKMLQRYVMEKYPMSAKSITKTV